MTGNYRLANKLKREFRERGSDVNGISATTTSELMRRAEMGRDPRTNCAEQAFRENYTAEKRTRPAAAASRTTQTNRRTQTERVNSSSFVRGNPSASARTPSGASKSRTAEGYSRSGITGAKNPGSERAYACRAADSAGREKKNDLSRRNPSGAAGEARQIQRKTVPPLLLAYLIVGTLLFFSFVFSITEVYKASNQVAELQNQLEKLEATAQDMELQLEEKNDIREIEAIATGRLGMVKEDSLQRRFVTLSDGERIELADAEEDTAAGGVMLSSVFSALGKFFERFR